MPALTQLGSHAWPNGEPALLLELAPSPAASVAALAARLGFRPDTWEHQVFGPARGAALRLPSGLVVSLESHDRLAAGPEARGPLVWADVGDVARRGVAVLAAEVLGALGLTVADVAAVAPPHHGEWAAAVLDARHAGRLPPVPDDFA